MTASLSVWRCEPLLSAARLLMSLAVGLSLAFTVAPGADAATSSTTVKEVQHLLLQLGYRPGPVDGQMGNRTRRAIRGFQRQQKLPQDGKISEPLLFRLRAASAKRGAASGGSRSDPATTTEPATLFAGPSIQSQPVVDVPKGQAIRVTRMSGQWAHVMTGKSKAGWLAVKSFRFGGVGQDNDESAGGAGFLRTLTGWFSPRKKSRQTNDSVTLGIRGLQREDIEGAQADEKALEKLEGFSIASGSADKHARTAGLVARDIPYDITAPVEDAGSGSSSLRGFFNSSGSSTDSENEGQNEN